MNIPHRSWQVPPAHASERARLNWNNEAVEEGENWKRSQRGYADFRKAADILAGEPGSATSREFTEYRNRLTSARLKTNVKTMVAGLADIRPIGGFHATKAFSSFANMMNKGSRALYLQNAWACSVKEWISWSSLTCTAWMRPVYRRNFAGHGKGNIYLDTFGMPSVCPVQVPSNGDFQQAYAMILLDEMPIWMAHGMFPAYQDRLRPTSSRYWHSADIRKAAGQNAQKRMFGMLPRRASETLQSDLYIPIRYALINDLAINETNEIIPMGEIGSPWYYKVPPYGSEIPDGRGKTRLADESDSRLYPKRRLIISSEECVMYDGPAFNWHGECDLIDFSLDKDPWNPMGFSPVHDGWPIQKAIDSILRGSMKRVEAQQNMPLGYNINAVTEKEAKDFDPFDCSSTRVGFDGDEVDKPFVNLVPDEVYHIRPEVLAMLDKLEGSLDYVHQMRDIVELSKARALGKDQNMLEQALSSLGPIVKSISGDMERGICRAWSQVGWLMLQYLPPARIMRMVGPENMPEEVFDYDPASLIPSHLPDEFPHEDEARAFNLDMDDPDALWKFLKPKDSKYSKTQRAQWMAENVGFTLVPNSIHELHQMQQVLLLLQFRQRGAPVSWATIMASSNVPDVEIPTGNTEQERFQAEREEEIMQAARMKSIVEGLGLTPPGAPPTGGGGGGGAPSGGGPNGRPPSAHAAPRLVSKDGGSRTTVAESN